MILQLPCKCYLLRAMDSDCCHSSFEAIEDRSSHFQDDRVMACLIRFLLKILAERFGLLDLGLKVVTISFICCISDLRNCDLL